MTSQGERRNRQRRRFLPLGTVLTHVKRNKLQFVVGDKLSDRSILPQQRRLGIFERKDHAAPHAKSGNARSDVREDIAGVKLRPCFRWYIWDTQWKLF